MSFSSGLKTIVVATDLDGRAEAALEYARKLAVAYGSRIIFAHGLDPIDYASVAGVPGKVLSSLTEQPFRDPPGRGGSDAGGGGAEI